MRVLVDSFTNVGITAPRPSIVSTTGSHIYIVVNPSEESPDYGIGVYRSIDDGQNFESVVYFDDNTVHGYAGPAAETDAVIDGSGTIHMFSMARAYWYTSPAKDISYARLYTDTQTWSSWSEAAALHSVSQAGDGDSITIPGFKVVLDANDKLHLLFQHEGDERTRYTNNVAGSWLAQEDVTTGTYRGMICTSGSRIDAFYMYQDWDGGQFNIPTLRVRTTSWQSPSTYAGNWSYGSKYGVVADNKGAIYRYYSRSEEFTGSYIFENGLMILSGAYGYVPYAANPIATVIKEDTRVVFYNNGTGTLYIAKDGIMPWTEPRVFITGSILSLGIEYQYFRKNEDQEVHVAYVQKISGSVYGLYYEAFEPDTVLRSSAHAYIYGGGHTLDPDEDIANTGTATWINELGSTTPLYSKLNDDSDTTYVWCSGSFIGSYFEVGLENPGGTPTGSHVLSWRGYRKTGSRTVTVKAELRKSDTLIAYDEQILSGTVYEFNKALTPAEIAQIGGDYTDLRVRFITTDVSH